MPGRDYLSHHLLRGATLGLFMGASGRKRTFVVQPQGVDLKLPSDIFGMTTVRYDETKANYVQAAADELLKVFVRSGPR
ncbi:MAG: TIR domain-containing protein [Polyangiaceae bacterium]